MRMLKALVTILLLIAAVLAIYGMTLPKSFSVSKSIQIDTFQKRIFPYVGDLKNHPKWSPWFEMDQNMTMTYSGDSQSIGQKVYWVSDNPQVGHGSQEITDIDSPNSVAYKISFGENGDYGGATARFDYALILTVQT